jgi:hypothetical protein
MRAVRLPQASRNVAASGIGGEPFRLVLVRLPASSAWLAWLRPRHPEGGGSVAILRRVRRTRPRSPAGTPGWPAHASWLACTRKRAVMGFGLWLTTCTVVAAPLRPGFVGVGGSRAPALAARVLYRSGNGFGGLPGWP